MKVLFDPEIFDKQQFGGISRCFTELILGLRKKNVSAEINLNYTHNQYALESGFNRLAPFLKNSTFFGSNKAVDFLKNKNRKATLSSLKRGDFDVYSPTYFDPWFLDHLQGKPFVLTVYDMIHEIFHDSFSADDPTSANKKLLAQKANKIISISEHTKKDMLDIWPDLDADKIEVVHLANSLSPNGVDLKFDLPKKYILFVGARKAYKNFNLLLDAITPLMQNDPDLHLICTGGGSFSQQEQNTFEKSNLSDKIRQYNLFDAELSTLYQAALFFVFPSKYEGFGIPVLESFACGCPAILSNISSLPEVGGDACLYVDPESPEDLREKMNLLLNSQDLRLELVEKGYKQNSLFSWEQMVDECYQIYSSI